MSKTISTASRTNFFILLPPRGRSGEVMQRRGEGLVIRENDVSAVSPPSDVDSVISPALLVPKETETDLGRNAKPTV